MHNEHQCIDKPQWRLTIVLKCSVFCLPLWDRLQQARLPDEWMQQQADQLPKDQAGEILDQLMQQYGGFSRMGRPFFHGYKLIPAMRGFSLKSVFVAIGTFMLHEILYNGKLLVTIVMLSVLSMILETLQTAFEKNNISKIAYSICYMVIIIICN